MGVKRGFLAVIVSLLIAGSEGEDEKGITEVDSESSVDDWLDIAADGEVDDSGPSVEVEGAVLVDNVRNVGSSLEVRDEDNR